MESAAAAETTEVKRPIYICAVCTYEVALEAEGRLICPRCASRTGSSCVFYKKRDEPTTYDTV